MGGSRIGEGAGAGKRPAVSLWGCRLQASCCQLQAEMHAASMPYFCKTGCHG